MDQYIDSHSSYLESSFNYSIANQLGHQLDNVAEHDEKNSTFQRLKENNVNDKIEVEVTLSLKDNISSFNFILKEHNNGVIYMGSQIDTCFYTVFIDE